MRAKMAKILQLVSAPHRIERTCSPAEIQWNRFLYKYDTPSLDVMTFDQFLAQLHAKDSILFDLLQAGGEAWQAVQWIRSNFNSLVSEKMNLPFPIFYNPDTSFALLN